MRPAWYQIAVVTAVIAWHTGARRCAADFVGLGTAANYGVLGLANTHINNSLVTVHGNEGVSAGGSLTNMAPSTVTGNAYEATAGQVNGPGHIGSIITDANLLSQNNADARSAAAALAPTQTLSTISRPMTIEGNGGLNVIALNGNITDSLTLRGTASDTFVVNVSGTLTYGGSSALGSPAV